MDDLTLLREYADRTPPPGVADLEPARARLLAEIATRATPHGRPRRRLALSGAAVVGLAAAITAVVALAPLEQAGVAPPKASAAEVLHQAADAARVLPDVIPRPDQFLYVKAVDGEGRVREVWLSIDGTHDGRIDMAGRRDLLPGCRDGRSVVIKGDKRVPGVTEPCVPQPAYLPGAPGDKDRMVTWLRRGLKEEPADTNYVGKEVIDLLQGTYLRPAARAALFEAIAEIDGLTIDEDAVDVSGRHGVGVSWSGHGYGGDMVLDRAHHTYLGSAYDALLAQAIVDRVGGRP